MPKRKVIFYLRCVDDQIALRRRQWVPMMIFAGNAMEDALKPQPPKIIKIKEVTKGNCYKATLYLKDPLTLVQLLETERGTLSRKLLQGSGRISHGCLSHRRFVRITQEEYESWRRSKMQ